MWKLFNRFAHSAGPSHWVAGCVGGLVSCVLSCRVSSCLVLSSFSCLVLPFRVLSCLVLSCLVSSFLVLSLYCLVLSCLVLSWFRRVLFFLWCWKPFGDHFASPKWCCWSSWGASGLSWSVLRPRRRPEVRRVKGSSLLGGKRSPPGTILGSF